MVRARPYENIPQLRWVYVIERDRKDPAAGADFLWTVAVSLEAARRVIDWAVSVRMPVRFEPPGNMADGWAWPVDTEAPAPTAREVKSSF